MFNYNVMISTESENKFKIFMKCSVHISISALSECSFKCGFVKLIFKYQNSVVIIYIYMHMDREELCITLGF